MYIIDYFIGLLHISKLSLNNRFGLSDNSYNLDLLSSFVIGL